MSKLLGLLHDIAKAFDGELKNIIDTVFPLKFLRLKTL